MRSSALIIFASIALSIYTLINSYILRRIWQATAGLGTGRSWILAFFLFFILCFPVSRAAQTLLPVTVEKMLDVLGSTYLAFMLYLFLLALLVDLFRIADKLFRFFPSSIRNNPSKTAASAFVAALAATSLVILYGYINALHPRIRSYNLVIPKPAGEIKNLNIVVVSDIHLGRIIRSSRLEKIVRKVNSFSPDLVLLPGDTLDESAGADSEEKSMAQLRRIKSRYGVFGCSGNHEYYGGIEKNLARLKQGNVVVLQDEALSVTEKFYIIGRKDRSAERMGDKRKKLKELTAGLDPSKPLILMDHQPVHLEEAEEAGIDLQVSGHTHAGQLFPLNIINKKIYETNWGYLQKRNTHYFVSSGVGTWGPPVRIGNTPEIVVLKVRFQQNNE